MEAIFESAAGRPESGARTMEQALMEVLAVYKGNELTGEEAVVVIRRITGQNPRGELHFPASVEKNRLS